MDRDFEIMIERCNIPQWYAKGYKGQGITIFCDDTDNGGHRERVKSIITNMLPEAKVLSGNFGIVIKSGEVQSVIVNCIETGERLPFEDFIIKYNVRLINNSVTSSNSKPNSEKANWMKKMIEKHNLIMTGSAGNTYGGLSCNDYIGACILITGCNLKKRSTYAEGDYIDFTAYAPQDGTSFASPFALSMAGLLIQKCPNFTQNDVYEYFKKHCEDIGEWKKDCVYGYGLITMGDVNENLGGNEVKENMIYTSNGNKIIDFNPITKTNIQTNGKILAVNRILYNQENYIRLRDFEDVLGVVDVEYDRVQNIATVED
jgi:hypothetical protein